MPLSYNHEYVKLGVAIMQAVKMSKGHRAVHYRLLWKDGCTPIVEASSARIHRLLHEGWMIRATVLDGEVIWEVHA